MCLQGWILKLLYQNGMAERIHGPWLALLGATALYVFAHKLLMWIYQTWAWRFFFRSLYIGGEWFHYIESAADPNYRRYGHTQVRQTLFEIQLTGINYGPEFDRCTRSLWRSAAVSMDNKGLLVFTYATTRAGTSEPQEKTGLMYAQLHGKPGRAPDRIEGVYQDASPSQLRGSITWQRKVSWDTKLPTIEALDNRLRVDVVAAKEG